MEQDIEKDYGRKTMNVCRALTIILGLLSLTTGGILYILYRSETLILFKWVKALGLYDIVSDLRPSKSSDSWLVYSLPDGLWLFAYILLMGALWNFDSRKSLLYSAPLVVIAIGSELSQMHHITKGTFDIVDLLCYIVATIAGTIYIKIAHKLILN